MDTQNLFTLSDTLTLANVSTNSAIGSNGMTNSGTLIISGGMLQLGGPYTQTAGVTRLNGGSISTPTSLDIQGGLLEGQNGSTILGDVTQTGGTIGPGLSAGILNLTGDFTQTGGTLLLEIGGTAAGAQYDQLNIGGAAVVSGTFDVVLINSFIPSAGDSFTIATAGGGGSGEPNLNLPALPAGLFWLEAGDDNSLILQVAACTISFDNSNGNGLWQDAMNWDTDTVPAAGDNVCIDSSFGAVKSASAGTDTVSSLTVTGSLDNRTGSSLTVDGPLVVNSPLTVSGGTVTVNNSADIKQLNITGGTLEVNTPSFDFNVNGVNMTGGTLNVNTTFFVVGLGGAVFNQSGGVTSLTDPASMLIGPQYNLTGGMLRGVGTVSTEVNNSGGTVAPGLSIGILTIQGNYTQSSTGTLNIELGGSGG
ncbi:MAG TPA: hypothetical protein VLD18_06645, partial [Verrucomicrobiae bacterium]|nr:hypothetical protein [Verrucomicrobiae bacterium]